MTLLKSVKKNMLDKNFLNIKKELDYDFAWTIKYKLLKTLLTITTIIKIIFMQINLIFAYLKSAFAQNKRLFYIKLFENTQQIEKSWFAKNWKIFID